MEKAMNKQLLIILASATLLTANAAYAGPPEAPEYEVTVIPGPFCGIFGYEPANGWGINDLGNICGDERNCAVDWEPFFWSPETGRIVLEVPAGFGEGRAQDLNNTNQIVGFLRLDFRLQAILWQDENSSNSAFHMGAMQATLFLLIPKARSLATGGILSQALRPWPLYGKTG